MASVAQSSVVVSTQEPSPWKLSIQPLSSHSPVIAAVVSSVVCVVTVVIVVSALVVFVVVCGSVQRLEGIAAGFQVRVAGSHTVFIVLEEAVQV